MKTWSVIVVFVVTLMVAHQAGACTRMTPPASTLAAMADVIIEGRIDNIDGDKVVVSIRRIHKGSTPGRTLEVKGMVTNYPNEGLARSCGIAIPRVGQTYLMQLFMRLPGEVHWSISSEPLSLNDRLAADIVRDKAPSTYWTRNAEGIWVKAGTSKSVFEEGEELNIWVLFRNGGSTTRTIRNRHWPDSQLSACSLDGKGINGVRVRIAQSEIENRFGRVPIDSSNDIEIGPGGLWATYLGRITTESPGYGYKENTGFEYFPLKPGKHKLNVVCRGFVDEVLRADGLRVEIRGPATSTSSRKRQ